MKSGIMTVQLNSRKDLTLLDFLQGMVTSPTKQKTPREECFVGPVGKLTVGSRATASRGAFCCVSMVDKTKLQFHITSNDYFGTLATVLDLLRQHLEKDGYKRSDSELLARKTKELMYLQSFYKIIITK